jgi:hypothetical protein
MFPDAAILAVTATADRQVEADVVRMTGMRADYLRLVQPPDRPNITYFGVEQADRDHLRAQLRRVLAGPGSAIVYVSSRALAQDLWAELDGSGVGQGHYYHAGMDPALRASVQERFMSGELRWIVATNAFGMGVDVPNIRLVYHWDHPGTIADLAQEAGRAGRDGLPSEHWLNITRKGVAKRDFFIRLANPDFWVYERLWKFLTGYGRHGVGTNVRTTQERLYGTIKGPEALNGRVDAAMAYLEFREHIASVPGPRVYRLPVLSTAKVREFMREYPQGIRMAGAVVTVTTNPDEDDPVDDMVRAGAVRYQAPEEAKVVRLLRSDLAVTEAEVDAKRGEAEAQHRAVRQFALVPADRKHAFLRAHFLPADVGGA